MADLIKDLYYKTMDEHYKHNRRKKHFITSQAMNEFYTNLYSTLKTKEQKKLLLDFVDKFEDMQAEIFAMGFRVGVKITHNLSTEDE